ncbi:MAG TPA: hypothetical protein VFA18_25145 [Gemmataceae bacterium]|nr:hypothetical protein [Gemmataceae bacterium]
MKSLTASDAEPRTDEHTALPFLAHVLDGHANGHLAIKQQFHLRQHSLPPPDLLLVSDRGTFSGFSHTFGDAQVRSRLGPVRMI